MKAAEVSLLQSGPLHPTSFRATTARPRTAPSSKPRPAWLRRPREISIIVMPDRDSDTWLALPSVVSVSIWLSKVRRGPMTVCLPSMGSRTVTRTRVPGVSGETDGDWSTGSTSRRRAVAVIVSVLSLGNARRSRC